MCADKGAQCREDGLFHKRLWEDWTARWKKRKLGLYLTSYTKITLNWSRGLKARPETVKLLERNIGEKLLDIGFGNDFLDMTSKAHTINAKIGKWCHIKLKKILHKQKKTTKWKTIYRIRENICKPCKNKPEQNSDEEPISRIYGELPQLYGKHRIK